MSVYHLQQLFLNKWLLSQTSIPINIANIAQTLGMECRRPKYGMVCRLLEYCQVKRNFFVKFFFIWPSSNIQWPIQTDDNRSYIALDQPS
jgi:hypothetical protein